MKFYNIHQDFKIWDVNKIQDALRYAMQSANLNFDHWKRTNEIITLNGSQPSRSLNWNPDQETQKITNGDMNITTDTSMYSRVDEQLFAGSGRRGNLPKDKKPTIANSSVPKVTDDKLSTLSPIFKNTILEELHTFIENKWRTKVRIRCQNRPVGSLPGAGLYWHKDNPVENRFHIPLWTNPGHVLLFSERNFKWEAGFDAQEAASPMDFVGHYVPADGRVYEFFTKDYMHAVASVGVGWYQDRGLQTRCHLSFWKALN